MPYQQTIIVPPVEVRAKFKKVKPLKELSVKERGWTLDALNIVAAVCDRRSLQTADIGAHRAPLQIKMKQETYFDLRRIPADARIVDCGGTTPLSPDATCRVKPLKEISAKERGWTLDVLNIVAAVCDRRSLQTANIVAHRAPLQDWKQFTNEDVYGHKHLFVRLAGNPGRRPA